MDKQDPFNVWMIDYLLELIEHGSQTRAAEKFGLSPAGATRALNKLRLLFNDPLLIGAHRRMQPTPFALLLKERLRVAKGAMESLTQTQTFDPLSCTRTFRVATRGFATTDVVTMLIRKVHELAPQAELDISDRTRNTFADIRDNLVDMALCPDVGIPENFHTFPLYPLKPALLLRKAHPLLIKHKSKGTIPSLEEISAYPHVELSACQDRSLTFNRQYLRAEIDSESVCSNSLWSVLPAIEETNLVTVHPLPAILAAMQHYRVDYLPLKMPQEPMNLVMVWGEITHKEPAMIWFRSLVQEWKAQREDPVC